MQILDYNLILTCPCCPEQYDVLDAEGKQSGYIRLRGGNFRVYYPDTGGELVFYHCFEGDQFKGMFDNDEEREFFLTEAVKAIHNKIQLEKEQTMKVQKTSTQPAFQPIEIKITIESQEELNHLDEICRNSVDVSNICNEYVDALNYDICVFLDALLNDIGECLSKGFKGT